MEKVFISEADQYLFSQATHYDIYKKLGAHMSVEGKEKGVYFGVWAPNARQVHVTGSFNGWSEEAHPLLFAAMLINSITFISINPAFLLLQI